MLLKAYCLVLILVSFGCAREAEDPRVPSQYSPATAIDLIRYSDRFDSLAPHFLAAGFTHNRLGFWMDGMIDSVQIHQIYHLRHSDGRLSINASTRFESDSLAQSAALKLTRSLEVSLGKPDSVIESGGSIHLTKSMWKVEGTSRPIQAVVAASGKSCVLDVDAR